MRQDSELIHFRESYLFFGLVDNFTEGAKEIFLERVVIYSLTHDSLDIKNNTGKESVFVSSG